jgi:RNA polymerase sigma-70 factor (ECF subfamily)
MLTFDQIYRSYFQDVYRFALWLSRDSGVADDLTSETFVRAWSRRDQLRTETLKAYLLAIVRNLFLKHRGRSGSHEELLMDLPDGAPDPQRRASSRIELDRVTSAIAQLPESDRSALVLRTEHSLPYAEIARVLEISETAARVKVHRARRRLLTDTMNNTGGATCNCHET